jgi:hypothetical protein
VGGSHGLHLYLQPLVLNFIPRLPLLDSAARPEELRTIAMENTRTGLEEPVHVRQRHAWRELGAVEDHTPSRHATVEDRAPSHPAAVEDRDAAPEGARHPRARHRSFEVPRHRAPGLASRTMRTTARNILLPCYNRFKVLHFLLYEYAF